MKPYLLLIATAGAALALSPLIACEPSCEDLLDCGPYGGDGGAGGSAGASSSAAGGSGGGGGATGEFPLHIAAARNHTCATSRATGSLYCWGLNSLGQLGNGTTVDALNPTKTQDVVEPTLVGGGNGHSCAVVDGQLMCWGSNAVGQLGDGSTTSTATAIESSLATGVTALGNGNLHNCAVIGGQAYCWGVNVYGQLGNGTATDDMNCCLTPSVVVGLTAVEAVSAASQHTCALSGGSVVCWGRNQSGELGNATNTNSPMPVAVVSTTGLTEPASVAAGKDFSCAINADGAVYCWGLNGDGQLGNGTTANASVPTKVLGITAATTITAGDHHACALLGSGSVFCWGSGNQGQLGNGVLADATEPVQVSVIDDVINITAGGAHTCAATSGGGYYCWGLNDFGQLGNGNKNSQSVPQFVNVP